MHIFRRILSWLWVLSVILCCAVGQLPSLSVALVGDIDADAVYTTKDVRLLLQYQVGVTAFNDEQLMSADYNGDGIINSSDTRALLFFVVNGTVDEIPPKPDDAVMRAAGYSGEPFVILCDNMPAFTAAQKQLTDAFETYAPLDSLGRCGTAFANICQELMPTEERESISSVTPTGWHNQQYEHIAGGWVYNRAHIIGFQLAGEQANKQNLITGTRYLNMEGMLPFENMIADYVKETDNHVLYRVTPIFAGDNLLAEGVRLEAWSVEDNGDGICFHVFCYNVQPGVTFDYATGENYLSDEAPPTDDPVVTTVYVLNTKSMKFHLPTCSSATAIAEENRLEFDGEREELIAVGYAPCGRCHP